MKDNKNQETLAPVGRFLAQVWAGENWKALYDQMTWYWDAVDSKIVFNLKSDPTTPQKEKEQ
jgi:hypothetical protein